MFKGLKFKAFRSGRPISVEGYRAVARRRVPGMIWEYIDGGADDMGTLRSNRTSFARWSLRQRSLTGHSDPRLAVHVAGTRLDLPFLCAPTGLAALTHWHGDLGVARAAERAGTRLVLSTASSFSIEEVGSATQEDHWFQLYPFGNRAFVAGMFDRARSAGLQTLVVTVDVPVRGNREGERLNGMTVPPTIFLGSIVDAVRHPRWWVNLLRHGRLAAANYATGSNSRIDTRQMVASLEAQERFMQSNLSWDDVAWMRDLWKGPMFLKGILDVEDATHAVDKIGVTGLVVSNHGGRQLDGASASVDALDRIGQELAGRTELILDGGVRRGTDIVKALCLGARAVMIGRPYLYGLAVEGEAGVSAVLDILRDEVARTLALMGCPGVETLDRSWLIRD